MEGFSLQVQCVPTSASAWGLCAHQHLRAAALPSSIPELSPVSCSAMRSKAWHSKRPPRLSDSQTVSAAPHQPLLPPASRRGFTRLCAPRLSLGLICYLKGGGTSPISC